MLRTLRAGTPKSCGPGGHSLARHLRGNLAPVQEAQGRDLGGGRGLRRGSAGDPSAPPGKAQIRPSCPAVMKAPALGASTDRPCTPSFVLCWAVGPGLAACPYPAGPVLSREPPPHPAPAHSILRIEGVLGDPSLPRPCQTHLPWLL